MKYLEVMNKVIEDMEKIELDNNAQQTTYLGLILLQLTAIVDELARMNDGMKSNNEMNCACTDEEISKFFMEDVSKQVEEQIIRVGDEIYSELTDSKAVVQRIDTWHRYQCFTAEGAQFVIDMETFNECWVKTGKNYPQIVEVLEQMKED